jgi:hypothetical protein
MAKKLGIPATIIVLALLVLSTVASAQTPGLGGSQTPAAATARDRILVYSVSAVDSVSGAKTAPLARLSALASANGIKLTVVDSEQQLASELRQPDVVGCIYGGEGQDTAALTALSQFVKLGGRALLLYDEGWVDQSTKLHETFGVSLASQHFGNLTDQGFHYVKGMLPPWLRDLDVGVGPDTNNIFLSAYLVIPGRVGERGMIITDEAKRRSELVFYSPLDGSISWEPRPVRQTDSSSRQLLCFFDDDNIGYHDNERAALTMLNFLLGNTPMTSG